MPLTVTPHTIIAQDQYNKALYQLLLMLEESGTVKTAAYTDDKGIPTIGVGINIRVPGHIEAILRTGFNMDWNSSGEQGSLESRGQVLHSNTYRFLGCRCHGTPAEN